ncbi:MAG: tetratricopeptide repeat protein [Spirochaetota bacterium]
MKRMILTSLLLLSMASFLPAQTRDASEQNRTGVENGKNGRYPEALLNFARSIELYDKDAARTIHNIGWLYELRGDDVNALIYYEEALRRNPNQLDTLDRAGYLKYKKEEYSQAIILGEKGMKIDPMNKDIIVWLPDAYAKLFQKKQQVITKVAEEKELKKIEEKVKEQKKEELKQRRYLTATFDITARMSYLRAGGSGFEYTKTNSYLLDLPFSFTLDFTPTEAWEIKAETGVPYYGALLSDLIWWNEKIEGYFYKKSYFLGMGLMGNHYGGKSVFGEEEKLSDYKLGLIFGKYQQRSRFDFILYPRLFPADTGTTSGRTMDVDSTDISFSYILTEQYKLYGRMLLRDFYFFDNDVLTAGGEKIMTSDYEGVYDFSIGVGLNDNPGSKISARFTLTEKMYLKNLDNTRPYKFANGQGFFGMDAYNWFKGNPFSGVQTFSTVFSVYIEEQVIPHMFLYQKVSVEMVSKSQRANDFCLQLGIGGTY